MSSASFPASGAARGRDVEADVRTWHGGWALAQLTLAGIALVVGGAPAAPTAGLLMLLAAPGTVGALRLGRSAGRRLVSDPAAQGMLALWSVAAAAAVLLSGGTAAPLAIYALAPAIAAAALGASWATGVGLACCAAVFVTVAQLAPRVGVAGASSLGAAGPSFPGHGDATVGALVGGGAIVIMAVAATAALATRFAGLHARDPASATKVASRPEPVAPASDASSTSATPGSASWEARFHEAQAARLDAETEATARARFLANMSHELRTPLNAIVGFSDIMRSRLFGPLPERYGEYAELIHESGRHLVDLINDVLDLSRIDAERYELRLERFDAREPVNGALRLMRGQAEESRVILRAVIPADPIAIQADPRAIKQIVLNLVSNALKFTPPGGEAAVILARIGDDEIEIAVTDTGVGIAPDDLDRLGRPFEQTDAGRRVRGSGLGLSLVRGFARLHGGDMIVESRLGEGTAVTVRIPVAPPAPSPAAPIAPVEEPAAAV